MIKLKRALSLYMKKKRLSKGYLRDNILSIVKPDAITKIQGLIRSRLANKRSQFMRIIKILRL